MPHKEYGQNETLISSIRNIIKDYPFESIFKEFLQNADDAGATQYHVIVDTRSHPINSLFYDEMKAWQGPAILIFNNAKFKNSDFESLMQIRVGGKQDDDTKIGKHGLGFNSCYHFTDAPSFVSGDSFAFLDPQEKFLRQRGIIGTIPKNGIDEFPEKDQLIPFQGIEGIDFRSTFEGTLFRIPLRKEQSEISDSTFTTDQVLKLFTDIKSNILSQFLFLRNVETIKTSHISEATVPPKITSLWEAVILELDENVRTKRKQIDNGENQVFQIKIRLTDNSNNQQEENHWIIANGAQQNPEDSILKKYAKRYRLRVLGGVAALLKSSQDTQNFMGRMYSFFPLPDATSLPVHLNGAWAQSSDRGKLLIENDNLPDLDRQKLNWNRHILLNFLPKPYCSLLKEIIELYKNGTIDFEDHPLSKFWPFPSTTRSYPKYIIEHGFKVLKLVLQNDEIFQLINDGLPNEDERANVLFKILPRKKALELSNLLRNNRDELRLRSNPDLKLLIRSLPIWRKLPDPIQPDSEPTLKPASSGHILPNRFNHYRTKRNSKIYLDARDDYIWSVLRDLDVPLRDTYLYVFEDVEWPNKSNHHYLNFLKNILRDNRIIQGLRTEPRFPSFTGTLKKIDKLYDHNNDVFRTVFGGSSDMFLHLELSEYSKALSSIGLKDKINQQTFIDCAKYIRNLQRRIEPPVDIRYRGFILIDYFYKHVDSIENFEENILDLQFVPISKDFGKPYNLKDYVTRPQAKVLDCFRNIILPTYKEVAWSEMSLIAEDVVPPENVLQIYPSLGKPEPIAVINHLRFLYGTLRNDDEWKRGWAGVFENNVFYVYEWLEKEFINGEYIDLKLEIQNEPLFLNYNIDQDPFNARNWVSATGLVVNSEPSEDKYVHPMLAKYPRMLISAGAGEVERPDIEINVRAHKLSQINNMFEFLLDQRFPLNDFTFVVSGENIKASRYMLAASSKFFLRKFSSTESNVSTISIEDIKPNSMSTLLRYLYGQDIDEAIRSLNYDDNENTKVTLYKNLLKLSDNYELDHLKELSELRLARLVNNSNAEDMKRFAETSNADQLEEYCSVFIQLNF